MSTAIYESSIGPLTIAVNDEGAVESIHIGLREGVVPENASKCEAVIRQLEEYFRGERKEFDLSLAPKGTDFQRAVWNELQRIPYGGTISYRDLAEKIGKPSAVRAVGAANGANPIPIVIPCHRVIGSDGKLTGYSGGLHVKEKLLAIEGGA